MITSRIYLLYKEYEVPSAGLVICGLGLNVYFAVPSSISVGLLKLVWITQPWLRVDAASIAINVFFIELAKISLFIKVLFVVTKE